MGDSPVMWADPFRKKVFHERCICTATSYASVLEKNGHWLGSRQVTYGDLTTELRKRVDRLPATIAAMKKADNRGGQRTFDDVLGYVGTKHELRALIRTDHVDGKQAIRIGEPNWVHLPLLLVLDAFAFGYLVGTACFEAGPCDFVG